MDIPFKFPPQSGRRYWRTNIVRFPRLPASSFEGVSLQGFSARLIQAATKPTPQTAMTMKANNPMKTPAGEIERPLIGAQKGWLQKTPEPRS
ncbi:hypothetical protein H0X09_01860 [Candidatus Saccharibacteria bacterium]|nr:hypothetical protein [Candidatus Saccharibacteria bacterium]